MGNRNIGKEVIRGLKEIKAWKCGDRKLKTITGDMKERVWVSTRGQITLPAGVRKRLGIQSGGVILIEERAGELILRPAAVLEIEHYSDNEIAGWDEQDS